MKKLKYILMVLVVAGLGIGAWYTIQNQQSGAEFKSNNSNFSVEDPSMLTMIFIADKQNRTHKFELKSDGRWLVNDDWYAAPYMMEMLLNTIKKMEVKHPVPTSARNTVIKNLAVQGIKVELYTGDQELLKTFYVGGTTNDDLGTHFIMENSETPFVMHIPGFNGFLTSRFEIQKTNWVDRIYFQCPKNKFESVSVSYSVDTMQSFQIVRTEEGLSMPDYPEADTSSMEKYIGYFANTHLESFIENEKRDSIYETLQAKKPYCVIELQSSNDKFNRKLEMYPFGSLDRMYGITEKDELVTLQYFGFQKFLVSKSFFEKRRVIL